MKRFARLAFGALVSISISQATVIGLGAFSSSATLINFDNLTGGVCLGCGDVIANQYAGLGVGFVTSGGTTVTANNSPSLAGVFPLTSLPNVAFVYQGGGGTILPSMSILFSTPVNRVGLDFGLSIDSFLTMAAYDNADLLIETQKFVGSSFPLTSFPFSGLAGFAGLEESTPIARIELSYRPNARPLQTNNYIFDNLRFEPVGGATTATPEPGAAILMGAGLAVLTAFRKKASGAA